MDDTFRELAETEYGNDISSARPQASRASRKAQRQSQPALILESIHSEARALYYEPPPEKTDLSYTNPRRRKPGGLLRRSRVSLPTDEMLARREGPISLYSILARHIRAVTLAPEAEIEPELTSQEEALLKSKGYSLRSVEQWTTLLLDSKSLVAADMFKPGNPTPPFFLVLLFLRRKHIRTFALGITMRHIANRLQAEPLHWPSLKLLVVRLLRHARTVWPESIPWIASLFSSEALRIYEEGKKEGRLTQRKVSDLTHFSNTFLSLLSLPTSLDPVISSLHQEKAQFHVLAFMASCEPPLLVTKTGFRSTARNQLAHAKTAQEREWAELKGPSWPPWKENRNAMDEDKDYDFGASRASRILHRMFEAGYGPGIWEEVAESYAGWDTDQSPTIQTRTSLPAFSTQYKHRDHLDGLLWAARVRATRTRREAWACFLAHETSDAPAHLEVYHAMFEKLHSYEIPEQEPDASELFETNEQQPLPGDMKEVLSDPKSPLHLVHLSEPMPTYEQLYHRMVGKGLRPYGRFLAFLVETVPDFSTVLSVLESSKDDFDGGVRHLLEGTFSDEASMPQLPGYFLASFIRFLCRFGRFSQPPSATPIPISPGEHNLRFKMDQSYLLEYAYALLFQARPRYRPAWTAYMQKLHFGSFIMRARGHRRTRQMTSKYATMFYLLEKMDDIELDPDDAQFLLACNIARYEAQSAFRGSLDIEETRYLLSTGPRSLRTLFHTLVGANTDPNDPIPRKETKPLPPHIPGPAQLHAYVRALGLFRDYEGLFSFATWAKTYHAEVNARAHAQRGGRKILYRTFVALRAAIEGVLDKEQQGQGATTELAELIKAQLESVKEWGWPPDHHLDMYLKGKLRHAGGKGFASRR